LDFSFFLLCNLERDCDVIILEIYISTITTYVYDEKSPSQGAHSNDELNYDYTPSDENGNVSVLKRVFLRVCSSGYDRGRRR
jgi:hypothetical protein